MDLDWSQPCRLDIIFNNTIENWFLLYDLKSQIFNVIHLETIQYELCYFSIMQRIKIKLEDDQADKLYKISKDKKKNVSSIIRQAIDDYLEKLP